MRFMRNRNPQRHPQLAALNLGIVLHTFDAAQNGRRIHKVQCSNLVTEIAQHYSNRFRTHFFFSFVSQDLWFFDKWLSILKNLFTIRDFPLEDFNDPPHPFDLVWISMFFNQAGIDQKRHGNIEDFINVGILHVLVIDPAQLLAVKGSRRLGQTRFIIHLDEFFEREDLVFANW